MPRVTALVCVLSVAGCAPTVAPELVLNRERLDFGEAEVGGTYRRAVVLSNAGDLPLSLTELRLDPPLPELELEGLPIDQLAAGLSEQLTVVYRPTAEGVLSAKVRLEAADGKGPRELPLEGNAVSLGAVVRVDPGASCPGMADSLDFGTVFNGDAGVRALTIESTGTGTIMVLKATFSPEDAGFAVEGLQGGLALPPGETRALVVRYDPTRPGPQLGTITLQTNSIVLPRIAIPICGTGMVSALCAAPQQLSFGDVAPSASSTAQVTVSSCGNLPATLQSASLIADLTAASGFSFDPAPVLPLVLAAGQSTLVDLRFDSTTLRTARSSLRLTSSSIVTPELIVPMGANLPPPCNARLGAKLLRFYKEFEATQALRVSNLGSNDCLIERLDIVQPGTDFSLVRPLVPPTVLAARSSMEFEINYAPASTAQLPINATLQLELDWVHEVALRGDPRAPPGCHLVPRSPSINFGPTSSMGSTLALANVGSGTCRISSVTFDEPGFAVSLPTTTIPGRTEILVQVSYVHGSPPLASAAMTVTSNDPDQPQLVVPILRKHVRCDPDCMCTAAQTPTYWRFSEQFPGSGLTPSTGKLGAFQESCDPKSCPDGQVSVEIDREVFQCIGQPPECGGGQGLDFMGDGWTCVPCALLVQYGGLFSYQRACAPMPALTCGTGLTPTFDARLRVWRCVETCNNGLYDQHTLQDGRLVCIPC